MDLKAEIERLIRLGNLQEYVRKEPVLAYKAPQRNVQFRIENQAPTVPPVAAPTKQPPVVAAVIQTPPNVWINCENPNNDPNILDVLSIAGGPTGGDSNNQRDQTGRNIRYFVDSLVPSYVLPGTNVI